MIVIKPYGHVAGKEAVALLASIAVDFRK